jgi:hypothetical protein
LAFNLVAGFSSDFVTPRQNGLLGSVSSGGPDVLELQCELLCHNSALTRTGCDDNAGRDPLAFIKHEILLEK